MLDQIQRNLLEKATQMLRDRIVSPASYDELKSIVENTGGFARAGWCGRQECEEKIKEETGADIRVVPFEQGEIPSKCIYCGQPSKKVVMFARAY
jgi:prolyl-tRNA synthetase